MVYLQRWHGWCHKKLYTSVAPITTTAAVDEIREAKDEREGLCVSIRTESPEWKLPTGSERNMLRNFVPMRIKCRLERGSLFLHQEDCGEERERQFKCYRFSSEVNDAHQLRIIHQNKKGAGEGKGGWVGGVVVEVNEVAGEKRRRRS